MSLVEGTVLVVDLGAQYAQLIARRVRETHCYSEIVQHSITAAEVAAKAPAAIILSGGPKSVYEDHSPRIDPAIYELGIPMLGICYGAQLMAQDLGGTVTATGRGEYGRTTLNLAGASKMFDTWPTDSVVWMSHGDSITEAPRGATCLATTPEAPVAAYADDEARRYGVQFHPEVVHTERGQELIAHFLHELAGVAPTWTNSSIIEAEVAKIRAQVGTERVLCALSGGVDSAVAAALVYKAIGTQLVCVFVDTGLMRANEGAQIEEVFRDQFHVELIHVKAADRFFDALEGVTDPERKRKIIGHEFIQVFERSIKEVQRKKKGKVEFLAQGTLYPDVIESLSPNGGPAATIKSHHNVGGLPKHMKLKLLEPLRELFKDEVRALGEALGLPHDMVWRHPFPGPGLAVRVCGDITKERLEVLRKADDIFISELRSSGQYAKVWQAFAVFLPVRSVGVMGDGRTYDNVCALRAVTSSDAMTADWARLPYDVLQRASTRIINEVKGINRVVYDVSSKPPATIEWE